MRQARRPIVAVVATSALLIVQAVIDPTGLLALVGWPGGAPQLELGWPIARYLVFVPVMIAVVWWAAVRAGERFWTMTAGVVLAALLAQAAACFAMTGNLALAAWAGGFITAKAVPSALIVAAVVRFAGGPRDIRLQERGSVWPGAIAFGAAAPLLAGTWWTGAAYAPLIPSPRADDGLVLMLVAMAMLVGSAWLGLRWMRRCVPGFLGSWLGALVAGGLFGLVQAVIGLVVDDGFRGDLWPLLAAYIHVADGLAFGACTGWIVAVVALIADRLQARARARSTSTSTSTSTTTSTVADAAAGTPEASATPAPTTPEPATPEPAASPAKAAAGAGIALAVIAATALTASLLAPSPATASASAGAEAADASGSAETSVASAAPDEFLRVANGRIADGDGHQVLLRGVNVNQLVDFYQARAEVPVTRPLSEADFADMATYGFNVVRLNLSWSALEPEQGELDAEYLTKVKQAVGWAKAHGIRTVLDMHQDGWSNAATAEGTECRLGTDPMWGYDGAPGRRTSTAPRAARSPAATSPPRATARSSTSTSTPTACSRRSCARGVSSRASSPTSRRSRASTCSTSPASARRHRSRRR